MLDPAAIDDCLARLGLPAWRPALVPLLQQRLSSAAHGDFPRWQATIAALGATADVGRRRELLLQLAPWRKGPFDLGGVHVDSEWRCNLKWDRVQPALAPLAGRKVLDVGCGNGYYSLRLREAGAESVLGIDPTLLYVMQFIAVQLFVNDGAVDVWPLRLEELPPASRAFDTTLSMGVLYHQRSPIEHIRQLRESLRPGGQLLLETLYVPGNESYACTPADRYARMNNVWLLPTIKELETWLRRSGFRRIAIVDRSRTTTAEQRSSEWMPFESLAEALDPADPERTVEGWPAPRRVVAVAEAP